MGTEWLLGVYGGKLVTAGDSYIRRFWKKLGELRQSPFLEKHHLRQNLVPHFFFIRPAPKERQAEADFDHKAYGLQSAYYEAMEGELNPKERGGLRIAAKGKASGNCFTVDGVPESLLSSISGTENAACVLALIDLSYGTARTGTFFNYRIEGSSIRFKPIIRSGNCLIGKGVLAGAWPELLRNWTGAMNLLEYEKEKHCPLNVGASHFKKDGMDLYITYRRAATDLRLDMPAAFIFLKEEDGFRLLAKNLGASMERTFGKCISEIWLRNVLADGNLVDYADINKSKGLKFDIRQEQALLDDLVLDIFKILYLSAAASRHGEEGLFKMLACKRMGAEERKETGETYGALLCEFMKGLGAGNLGYFQRLENIDELLPYCQRA